MNQRLHLPQPVIDPHPDFPNATIMRMRYYISIIRTHPDGKEILQRLESDGRVQALRGKMIKLGSVEGLFDVMDLACWYVWYGNEYGFEEAERFLERFLDEDKITIQISLWVLGVVANERIPLFDDFEIVPVQDMPVSTERDQYEKHHMSLAHGNTSSPRSAVTCKARIPKVNKPGEDPKVSEDFSQRQSQLYDIALLLNAIAGISCTPHYLTSYPVDAPFGPFGGGGGGGFIPDVLPKKSTNVESKDTTELHSLARAFAKKPRPDKERFHRILRRMAQAKGRSQIEDKILDISIALEMLLLNDNRNNGQLALSFRLRGSWFLAIDADERSDLYAEFRDLYNYRSQVAHSGKFQNTNDQNIEKIRGNFDGYALLAERVVQKIILNGEPNWNSMILGTG